MLECESQQLLERVRSGDKDAAEELFERYVDRLIELARKRLSPRLARRLDPEDIVQSACRSFFRLARAGRYELNVVDAVAGNLRACDIPHELPVPLICHTPVVIQATVPRGPRP